MDDESGWFFGPFSMDRRRAGTGNGIHCNPIVHQHGSDGTGIEKGGQCTSGAVHPFVIPVSLSQVTPRQGRADEQVHSCFQGCGKHSGEFVGQDR